MPRGKARFYVGEPYEFDPSPLYACDVVYDEAGIGHVQHGMAFDPRHGPESEFQIEWHEAQGKIDTSGWKVGEPC